MSIEGHLNIRLHTRDNRVQQVDIESSRPVHAARVFHGKTMTDCRKMLPMLFSICATAQSCAAARACEQASGKPASAQLESIRTALVNLETLREHCWRIFLDWPVFLGSSQNKDAMVQLINIQRDYKNALCGKTDIFQPGVTACQPDTAALQTQVNRLAGLLEGSVFSMTPSDWLQISRPLDFFQWLNKAGTAVSRFTGFLLEHSWAQSGRCEIGALPEMADAQLHELLADPEFVARPDLVGQCCETSSLTRVDSALLQELKQEYGSGLLVRTIARLTEIALLAGQLAELPLDDAAAVPAGISSNPGIGQVAAARGQLVHRVRLEGEHISQYQILAPTEWNFHPQGVVAGALSTLKGDAEQIRLQADLLINAIDPCVGYELTLLDGVADA